MTSNIHPLSDVKTKNLGKDTKIWQFCVVLKGAKIGANCNVCANVFIENDVVIGNNVTIKNGVQIWDGVILEDNVFIGPNVSFTNDLFPRSKVFPEVFLKTVVKRGASVGANATILAGIVIGEGAMVGAGAVVTSSVPNNAILVGNPARIIGYANTNTHHGLFENKALLVEDKKLSHAFEIAVRGVTVHKLPVVSDMRGTLTVGEFERNIPFIPRRYFMVYDVPSKETRGEHAHYTCHQFLICAHGSCVVLVDDGVNREEIVLDSPDEGVYIKPMVWGVQYKYSSDALLLVFASHHYDADDYIRDYSDFLNRLEKFK